MLTSTREATSDLGFAFCQTDARWLPFPDNSFDRVIANHMLYHVPDRPAALSEIRRVLRPGGRLFAATNSGTSMNAFTELVESIQLGSFSRKGTFNFDLENGANQQQPYFNTVKISYYEDALDITESQPVVDYTRSTDRVTQQTLVEIGT